MIRFGAVILMAVAVFAWAGAAWADDEIAPQILTTDLTLDSEVTTDRLTVNFVIVGGTTVTSVLIDGQAQQFAPGDTVTVTKEFVFTKQRTPISVVATDKDGNKREKVFLVRLKGAAPEDKLVVSFSGEVRYEIDGNPTNDLGTPVPLGDTEINGVVEDTEQPDTRTTVRLTAALAYGRWSGFAGIMQQSYAKSENEGLKLDVSYFGGGGRFNMGGTRDFVLTYVFSDVNVGDNDYAVMNMLAPAIESRSEDRYGSYRHTFALDFVSKDFASADQKDGSQTGFRWAYNSLDTAKQDSFDSVIVFGNSTEGIEEQNYTYSGFDFDWMNRWDAGFRFDIGFGLQYRSFPEDKQPLIEDFGEVRIDTLWRLSAGLGWQFSPLWSAMLNYRYLTDISNKSPYVRPLYGLAINGGF